ncbi:MAG: RdgB/HAM1 family non-canonical purine NTP pyrophosphatase, partial [Acidobacteria bacterium]|nr:RdgB/HAM1 family non-canonical purine NTP pyrophosphatase [Acidobacteriota bacterium]MDW7983851.1 RdgB/HAM1 family non-canonical purine NTP pyrophosphatase [Acidobacteriota bacterium]
FLEVAGLAVEVRSGLDLDVPEPEESGTTFLENARRKALYYAPLLGCPTLADDSGLVVEALHGFPGVHSARWGRGTMTQTEKNDWILDRLRGLPPGQRRAWFVCALAFAEADRILWETEVRVEGQIAEAPRGEGGFGYDPIFLYPPLGKTFAELTVEEKNAVSHRGRALRAWLEFLLERGPSAGP